LVIELLTRKTQFNPKLTRLDKIPCSEKELLDCKIIYMDIFVLVVVVLILLILVFVALNFDKIVQKKLDAIKENLKLEISSTVGDYLNDANDKTIGRISKSFNDQNLQINETNNATKMQFQELNNQLAQSQLLQNQGQKTQFSELGKSMQEALVQIQNAISHNLSKAISDLSSINNQNFDTLRKTNQEKLDQINTDVQKKLDINFAQHLKSFEEVAKNIGQVQTLAQRMIDSTSSIDKLNNVFARSSSKSFGDFGEKYLESILSEHLSSGSWNSQVGVPASNEKIDFVIQLDDKRIGIDSKFPLTKFQDYLSASEETKAQAKKEFLNAVLLMAKDINSKYNKNNFVDHLMMYLPSDSMYHEIVNEPKIMQELQKLNITPISPVTIFPVIVNIRVYQQQKFVNDNAADMIKGLKQVHINILSFQEEFRKLGDKLRQAQTNYDSADRSLSVVSKEIRMLETTTETEDHRIDVLV
jgi:DNA recombination protein RmuC